MGMRELYAYAIETAKGRFHGHAEERGGKLHFVGTVVTEADKNRIWDAIKTIPTWQTDIVADIEVTGEPTAPAAPAAPSTKVVAAARTYTVKAGDTLSGIALAHLGSARAYMQIFELNRDQLTTPDKIEVGQVLKLPE